MAAKGGLPPREDPDGYAYWLGVSWNEANAMIAGEVPEAVKQELRELIVLLDESVAEKIAKSHRKKQQQLAQVSA